MSTRFAQSNGGPSQAKIRCFDGKGTGHWAEDWGTKVTPNPVLAERVGFPFGEITCYSMKMGLVPLARGLVPVLKENIIWLRSHAQEMRRKMHRNIRRLSYWVSYWLFFFPLQKVSAYQFLGSKYPHCVKAHKLGSRATGASDSLHVGSLPESLVLHRLSETQSPLTQKRTQSLSSRGLQIL